MIYYLIFLYCLFLLIFLDGVRMDRFWCRPKRFSNEEYWNPRNRRYQKSPKKGLKADRLIPRSCYFLLITSHASWLLHRSASSNLRNNNADYVSTRALQHADGASNRKCKYGWWMKLMCVLTLGSIPDGGGKKNLKSPMRKNKQNKDQRYFNSLRF